MWVGLGWGVGAWVAWVYLHVFSMNGYQSLLQRRQGNLKHIDDVWKTPGISHRFLVEQGTVRGTFADFFSSCSLSRLSHLQQRNE